MKRALLLFTLAGCGRSHFAPLAVDGGDASIDAAPASDAPPGIDAPLTIPGLVLRVPMDDDTSVAGTIASSDAGLVISCDPHCPASVAGQRGNGFRFATGGYFTIPRPALLSTATPFTVGVWLRTQLNMSSQFCIAKPYSPAYAGDVASVWVSAMGTVAFETSTNGEAGLANNLETTTLIADNQWVYAAVTWDGSVKRIYLDGVLEQTSTMQTLVDSTESVEVGRDLDFGGPLFPFAGDLDELVFYDRALSDSEVALLPSL